MDIVDKIILDAKEILKEYDLCNNCLGRLFAPKLGLTSNKRFGNKIRGILEEEQSGTCYICKYIMSKLDVQLTKDRKSTRLNSSHIQKSRMPSSA